MIPLETSALSGLGRLEARGDRVTGVQVDSRRISPGDLFVAVGRGATFTDDALARGAAATLVPDDAFAALALIGLAVRERSGARVVGITGSTGKTSTKDILDALCKPSRRTVAAEASFNNEIGVPLTLCRLEQDTEVCIVELGMRGLGQIAHLCAIARPEIGVITNVGPVHLELVETIEGVVRAKGELVDSLPSGGVAIVPEGFPVARHDLEVVRVPPDPESTVVDGRAVVDGVAFNFTARHQMANAVAALAAARALGLPAPPSVAVDFAPWRGDELELAGGGLLVNDAYNANPISMRAALEYLAEVAGDRRKVAILGDMAELGRTGARYHREIGVAAAQLGVDELLAVGALAAGYLDGGVPGRSVPNVHEALRALDEVVREGDAVLVKASRVVGLEAVAEALAKVPAA
ncbi:MAG TPA: UDP-N-acetylmuramoyl-tripeptide--D-alanyl-D-alanine ligase [Gaiellaceae bacterium]|nr:UDP-N-acetylmuramoyl-tripeptide--D-alanyl-D-alanine ligase [Gaiellaceae bacterium]